MSVSLSSVLSFAQSAAMPFAYVVGGIVLGHYVPKAWTALAAIGSKIKAVYNVGKAVVAQAEAVKPATVAPPAPPAA